jgi:hypothetical protein
MAKIDYRKTMKLPRYSNTFHGLHKWYKHMFEKLGWMVLAEAKGYHYKVSAYKKSIDNLIKSLEHVIGEYKDHNKIHDLNVLLMNAKVLQEHVRKDF